MPTPQWVGGQAVVEGVMMRHRDLMAIAYRCGDHGIGIYREKLVPLGDRYPLLRWPVIRGGVVFLESLVTGMRALNISAARVLEEEGEELASWHMVLMAFLGLGLGVGLFFILPTLLVRYLPLRSALGLNLVEGLVRMLIFWPISP